MANDTYDRSSSVAKFGRFPTKLEEARRKACSLAKPTAEKSKSLARVFAAKASGTNAVGTINGRAALSRLQTMASQLLGKCLMGT